MLGFLKRLISEGGERSAQAAAFDRLQVAVAVLLHEARRADHKEASAEREVAEIALAELFGLERDKAAALLAKGRERARELTSFYPPLDVVKRSLDQDGRIRVVEKLWRVSFADGELDPDEDHYVRKIADLLYVPNTQSMLARNRARDWLKTRQA